MRAWAGVAEQAEAADLNSRARQGGRGRTPAPAPSTPATREQQGTIGDHWEQVVRWADTRAAHGLGSGRTSRGMVMNEQDRSPEMPAVSGQRRRRRALGMVLDTMTSLIQSALESGIAVDYGE